MDKVINFVEGIKEPTRIEIAGRKKGDFCLPSGSIRPLLK